MEAVFLKLLNMSITAGWLILAVLLLRLVLWKAPKSIRCVLWGLVGIRLVLPFSLESAFSLIPSAEPVTDTLQVVQRNWNGETVTTPIAPNVSQIETELTGTASVTPVQAPSLTSIFAVIWLVGVAALLVYSAVSYFRLRRRVATAVRLRDNLYQSEAVDSPFILGLLRPRIYLPFRMDEGSMASVVAHEQAHIRRRDHWWKPLGFLLLTVYWFNPLIWVAYVLLCRDIELACDERVIRDMSAEEKKAYSTALLQCSISRSRIAACPLAFGEVGVKERIKNVLSYKKPAFWVIVVAVVACIIAAVCFLTNPKSDSSRSEMLKWAQTLTIDDVWEMISYDDFYDVYSHFPDEKYEAVVNLMNQIQDEPYHAASAGHRTYPLLAITTGEWTQFYISVYDDEYIEINDCAFAVTPDWLEAWSELVDMPPNTEIAAPLFWAQHLSADQVINIEWTSDIVSDLTACPETDYAAFISLLNQVEGSVPDDSDLPDPYVTAPAPGWPTLYITMYTQSIHTVTIINNSILSIDGARFDVGTEWMDRWYDTIENTLPFALYGDSFMTWAQNLTVDRVSEISCGQQGTDFWVTCPEEDLETVVKLINAFQGELIPKNMPASMDNSFILTILTTDGMLHQISIWSEGVLNIDGCYFSADPDWLNTWWEDLLTHASAGIFPTTLSPLQP